MIIGWGHNPKDVKVAEALIKKKNVGIVALRKKLKLPPLMYPYTIEVVEKKNEEELMDLVLKLNEKLRETEQELEKTLESRQSESTSHPLKVVSVLSMAVPSTLATALAQNVPLATTEAIVAIGTYTITTQVGTSSQRSE